MDLAVDLGSARTLVAVPGRGIVVDEPTVAAVDLGRYRLVAFGEEANEVRGRAAGEVAILRPVRHGQLLDLDLTQAVAADLLKRTRATAMSHPTVLCCATGAATGVQRRALERAFKKAGARRVRFVEQAVAVALGAGLHIEEPVASMVVDVGAGTTEIGVLALGGLVSHASVDVGGEDFDEAIRQLCARHFDLVIDPATAERVKRMIGSAWVQDEEKVEVIGRDLSSGIARAVVLSRTEVAAAMSPRVERILAAATHCITEAPPDLANDLLAPRAVPRWRRGAAERLPPAPLDRHRHPGPPGRRPRALRRRRRARSAWRPTSTPARQLAIAADAEQVLGCLANLPVLVLEAPPQRLVGCRRVEGGERDDRPPPYLGPVAERGDDGVEALRLTDRAERGHGRLAAQRVVVPDGDLAEAASRRGIARLAEGEARRLDDLGLGGVEQLGVVGTRQPGCQLADRAPHGGIGVAKRRRHVGRRRDAKASQRPERRRSDRRGRVAEQRARGRLVTSVAGRGCIAPAPGGLERGVAAGHRRTLRHRAGRRPSSERSWKATAPWIRITTHPA